MLALPERRKGYKDAAELIESYGVAVAGVMIPERAAFHHSVGAGKVVPELDAASKATQDVASLWLWTGEQVGMLTSQVGGITPEQVNLFTGEQV